jgi:hypothetical protein
VFKVILTVEIEKYVSDDVISPKTTTMIEFCKEFAKMGEWDLSKISAIEKDMGAESNDI